jgi:hypothetical protein
MKIIPLKSDFSSTTFHSHFQKCLTSNLILNLILFYMHREDKTHVFAVKFERRRSSLNLLS